MEKRNVPMKNYFILSILVVVTVILTFYFVSWYEAAKEYKRENSVIAEVLSQIRIEEVDNYLVENPNIVVYMASSKDQNVKAFESAFKKFIIRNEIADDVVYLDIDTITDDDYQVFEKRYDDTLTNKNVKITSHPNLLIIREGKVIDVLYKSEQAINEADMNQFLEIYEVVEP